jgi:iron(III) transport system substrate-binding protein
MRRGNLRAYHTAPPALAAAILASAVSATAALPQASPVTTQLVEAARREGKLSFYTAVDVEVAEKVAAAFKAKYPGIDVLVERAGSERVFQRVEQERSANINNADVVNSSDAAHYIIWKREDLLAPYVPQDVAAYYQNSADPDG